MSTTPQQSPSPLPAYSPPLELLQTAEELLRGASPDELAAAARAYVAYGSVTGGKSAIPGSELPDFDVCRPLVKAGWIAVVREQGLGCTTLKVDVSGLEPQLERLQALADQLAPTTEGEAQIDPFLLGIAEISSAMRDLAAAQQSVHFINPHAPPNGPVADLIASVAAALHERVKALAPPADLESQISAEPEN